MDEFNREIEKWWRNKFSDEIENSLMTGLDGVDEATKWFNLGMTHAARIVRHSRDED
jgi:hypothetical protein